MVDIKTRDLRGPDSIQDEEDKVTLPAEKQPFEVKVENAVTVKAMRAADRGKRKRPRSAGALFGELGI